MANKIKIQYYESPCGEMVLGEYNGSLCLCDWNSMPCARLNMQRLRRYFNAEFVEETSFATLLAEMELSEYFKGKLKSFSVPLLMTGTEFQKSVWQALLEIPYGETRTYLQIAERIGNPKGVRAVAQAIGANGLAVFIPCHRVIGSNKTLTGFAGGLEAKRLLLGIEGNKEMRR